MVRKFIEYLKVVKKRSESTIKVYQSTLREFQRFMPITEKSWNRYLDHIAKAKPKTQKNKLNTVKEFLNWLESNGFLKVERKFWMEAEPPKESSLPKYLTADEIKRLIQACDNEFYKSLFLFLANTGLRIAEALSLTMDDITLDGETARIRVRGKGNKERILNVNSKIVEQAIKAGVFTRKITPRAVQMAIKKYAEKAGIKKRITPHVLRHSFAIMLVERNVPINKVQALLGHSNVATTSIYLKVASESISVPQLV